MTSFPNIENHGTAKIANGSVTFSYIDSWRSGVTATRPLLTPEAIVSMVKGRIARFDKIGDWGGRECDKSRYERKYISAQPIAVLRQAWAMAGADVRKEMEEMFNPASHSGISDPAWVALHTWHATDVMGDDGKPLSERPASTGNSGMVMALQSGTMSHKSMAGR